MIGPFALLRFLARPLAALGVVLTLLATVVPGAGQGTGLCLGTGDAQDAIAPGTPHCEACLLVALPAPPPATLPQRRVGEARALAVAAEVLCARGPEAARIRDPPAL